MKNIKCRIDVDDNCVKHSDAAVASVLDNHKMNAANNKIKFFLMNNLKIKKRKFVILKKIQNFEIEFIEAKELPLFRLKMLLEAPQISYAFYTFLRRPAFFPKS